MRLVARASACSGGLQSAVIAALCLATLALAQQQPAEPGARVPPPRPFQLPPRIGIFTQMPLSLDDTLAMALANNRDVAISRIDQQRSVYSITSAQGAYDPRLGGVASFQNTVVPIASTLGGSTTGSVTNRNGLADPQVTGILPWLGSSYTADLSSQRTVTTNTFTQLNPQFPTALNFSYTQPLWRGLRYDDNRRRLEVARKNQSLTGEQFRQRVMEVVTRAEQAYWDLAYAYGNLEVQLEAVRLGREQDESNRRQEQQGLLAPIDVVAAQRQLATFEQSAYSAQEALTTAENAVKTLILPDRGDPLWSAAIVPVTPVNVSPPVIPLADAITEALSERPELAQLRISREINLADNRYFQEQTKPQMDVVATHSNAGLAGAQLPAAPNPFTSGLTGLTDRINQLSLLAGLAALPSTGGGTTGGVPQILLGGYGTSLSNIFRGNFPATQVQLRISLPLRNRTAEANLNDSLAQGRRIRTQQEQTELTIEANVRNAMQSVESSRARLASARVARASAEEQYESEQRQFRAGTSTLFLVQQRQNDMITARSQERRAASDLGKAIAAFELATGRVLRVHNIDVK
jgi:HAE1 family hydrophobic/amphiphilic exporter-1